MNLNRKELKKICYDFNSKSSRVLQANFEDYLKALKVFLNFIDSNQIIKEYILDCGNHNFNIEEEFNTILTGYGRYVFDIGNSEQEEVVIIYDILKYIDNTNHDVSRGVGNAYNRNTSKLQDNVKVFNERVVKIFMRNIESYLTKVGIDMGADESIRYNLTVNGGQVNLAQDNSTINAVQNNGYDLERINLLISDILKYADNMNEKNDVNDYLNVIQDETLKEVPKKSIIKSAITALSTIKGSADFTNALFALQEYLKPLL